MNRKILVVVLAGVLVAATTTTALAGHQTNGVLSYTGCLVPNEGVMIKIKQGDAPKSPCSGGQIQAHFSGGDITRISVGNGLVLPLGGDNGEVRIELASGQTLPSGCQAGRVVEWNGSAWVCGVDDDTTYSAGTGLGLSAGNQFSIEPSYRVRNDTDCGTGKFATGFSDTGQIACSAPATASGIEVWRSTAGVTILPKDEGVDLIKMPLPAGTYLITAVASVGDRIGSTGDEDAHLFCRLRDGAFQPVPGVPTTDVDLSGEFLLGPEVQTVLHGVVTLAAADTVRFTCSGSGGDTDPDQASDITMTAVKVGTVHTP
jgi:hypothetical protein